MTASGDAFDQSFGNICRLCLKQEGLMSSIFEEKNSGDGHSFLAEKISSIVPVQIKRDDELPATVCHTCQRQVEKFYNFRIMVEISDRTLRSCLETSQGNIQEPKIKLEVIDESDDVGYKDFATENDLIDSDVDLSGSLIFVQTEDGIQVLKVCDIDGSQEAETGEMQELVKRNLGSTRIAEDSKRLCDSDIDDLEGIQRFLKEEKIEVEDLQAQVKDMYTCEHCGDFFLVSKDLSEHLAMHEQRNDDTEDIDYGSEISCQLCFKVFQSLSDLKTHISEHFVDDRKMFHRKDEGNVQEVDRQSISYADVDRDSVDITAQSVADNFQSIIVDNRSNGKDKTCNDENSFTCLRCQEVFLRKQDYTLHLKMHLPAKSFKCTHCDKILSTYASKREHEQSHTSDKIYMCVVCGRCFAKKSELKYHEGTHVNVPSVCTVCNKQFVNIQSFKMHMKRHILGSRYVCKTCGKSYYTNSELARHVQMHSGKRAYPCHLCETSFLSRPELNRHLKYHKGEKKFRCKICFKSYFESSHLKIHERVHTGEKPFACTICNKAFITKPKLVRHTKIHTKERIIICDILPNEQKIEENDTIF